MTTLTHTRLGSFKDKDFHICYLSARGMSPDQIARGIGVSEYRVNRVVRSEQGREILERIHNKTIDTFGEVQAAVQAIAPVILYEKVATALNPEVDPRVRNQAQTEILHMAGHSPVKRMALEVADPVADKYRGLSETDLRAAALSEIYEDDSDTAEGGSAPSQTDGTAAENVECSPSLQGEPEGQHSSTETVQ